MSKFGHNQFFVRLKNATTWNQVEAELTRLDKVQPGIAGKVFELFAEAYFKQSSEFSRVYTKVYRFRNTPLQIKEKLSFGVRDRGVDLILCDNENKLFAVQCKFRSDKTERLSWTKDKLANLFAEANKADGFIVFTNAAGIDQYSARKQKVLVIDSSRLISLCAKEISKILAALFHKRGEKSSSLKKYSFQSAAIKATVAGFRKGDRGQLILPCGAGKTLTSLWIAEKLKAKKILVLVPSLALLRQTKMVWSSNIKQWAEYLCVCSESDIDRSADSTVTEPFEVDSRVSSSPREILQFLRRHERGIIYSTYQSLPEVSAALKGSGIKFDFAIADEAHRTAGSSKGLFALIHNQKKVPAKKRLYMTATPRIINPLARAKLGDQPLLVADMSNQTLFGPEFFRLSFAEAIRQKILVDYRILAIGVSNHEIARDIRKRQYVSENATLADFAHNVALEKVLRKYRASHAISFHSNVSRARNFIERHQSMYRGTMAYHVNGSQPTSVRLRVLEKFREARRSVVSNARCLTEGIDVPNIDVVIFCDPRSSKVDIVQATGRTLRQAKDKRKKMGYVVVPIFHKIDEKTEEIIESGPFRDLVKVIRAMADQDERLEEEIRRIKLSKGHSALRRINSIPIDSRAGLIVPALDFNEKKLSQALFDQIIEKTPVSWRPFGEARKLVRNLGFRSGGDWRRYCNGEYPGKAPKPADIPTYPEDVFAGQWLGMGDWLGTGTIATQLRRYRPFKVARAFVRSLRLESWKEWKKYCAGKKSGLKKKPADIPANPNATYAKEWMGYNDWIGSGNISSQDRKYRSFSKARKFARSLHLKQQKDWYRYCSGSLPDKRPKPLDIPTTPDRIYGKKFKGMGDWLGTGAVATFLRKYRRFAEARAFVRKLRLKSQKEWSLYCAGKLDGKRLKPRDIPNSPYIVYKTQWKGIGDWLGTGIIANRLRFYRSFRLARRFVHKLGLKSQHEWFLYSRGRLPGFSLMPADIPAAPHGVYKKNWRGYGDWIGTGTIAPQNREFLPFRSARRFARRLKLRGQNEWYQYSKGLLSNKGIRPPNIPSNPQVVYKKSWKGFGDWLGFKA